jgi:hypothetical protein
MRISSLFLVCEHPRGADKIQHAQWRKVPNNTFRLLDAAVIEAPELGWKIGSSLSSI